MYTKRKARLILFFVVYCQLIMGLNMYDILEPCYHKKNPEATSTKNTSLPKSFQELGKTDKPLPVRKRMFGRAWPYRAPVRDGIVPTWPQLTQSLQARGVSVPCTVSLLISKIP